MPADIQIHEMTALAAGVNKTDGTIRFKKANNTNVDTADPIPIPESGVSRSYTKTLRSYMAAPPDTQVENLRWYTGGAGFGAGIAVNVKNIGTTWEANSDAAMTGGSDIFGYVSGTPLDGDGVDTGPFGPARDETYLGDLIRMQMVVDPGVTPGTLAAKPLTHAYDEI